MEPGRSCEAPHFGHLFLIKLFKAAGDAGVRLHSNRTSSTNSFIVTCCAPTSFHPALHSEFRLPIRSLGKSRGQVKLFNNRVSCRFLVRFGLLLPFSTTGCRLGRVRRRPLGQPGDFPRVWGALAGVSIWLKKSAPDFVRTRSDVSFSCAGCQGQRLVCDHIARQEQLPLCQAEQHCPAIDDRSGVAKRGTVQYRYCFAKTNARLNRRNAGVDTNTKGHSLPGLRFLSGRWLSKPAKRAYLYFLQQFVGALPPRSALKWWLCILARMVAVLHRAIRRAAPAPIFQIDDCRWSTSTRPERIRPVMRRPATRPAPTVPGRRQPHCAARFILHAARRTRWIGIAIRCTMSTASHHQLYRHSRPRLRLPGTALFVDAPAKWTASTVSTAPTAPEEMPPDPAAVLCLGHGHAGLLLG